MDWVNEVFADLMGAEDRPHHGSVRHVKAESPPGNSSAVDAGVKIRLFEDGEGQSEAQFIATQVATVMERDPDATIAILVRAKSHAGPVTAALEQAGIPFSGDAIQSLADQPVISDLLALCRYLANPADTIAAISLLRGPWCGVTLNTLNQLLNAHPERPLDLLQALQHLPSVADDEGRRLQRVLAVLQWAEMKRDRLALSIWVEQIWLRLGGSLAARGHDLWRVEMFLSLLRKAETSGLGLSIDWLEREITSATVESPDTDSRVTIMTLHKAKGLEFDYVFVPHLQKRARSLQRELIRWHWHGHIEGRRLLIAANDDDKESKTLYNYLNWLQKQKDQEELKRLLYVGVTRAKVATFLTASIETADDEEPLTECPVRCGGFCSLQKQLMARLCVCRSNHRYIPPIRVHTTSRGHSGAIACLWMLRINLLWMMRWWLRQRLLELLSLWAQAIALSASSVWRRIGCSN